MKFIIFLTGLFIVTTTCFAEEKDNPYDANQYQLGNSIDCVRDIVQNKIAGETGLDEAANFLVLIDENQDNHASLARIKRDCLKFKNKNIENSSLNTDQVLSYILEMDLPGKYTNHLWELYYAP